MALDGEVLRGQIFAKGDEIRQLKARGATAVELKPHIEALSGLKADFQAATGQPYDPPKQEKEKPAAAPAGETPKEGPSKKDLKKAEKKAAKLAAKGVAKEGASTADASDATPAATPAASASVVAAAADVSKPSAAAQASSPRLPPPLGTYEVVCSAAAPPAVTQAACALTGSTLKCVAGKDHFPLLALPVGRGGGVSGDIAIARYVVRTAPPVARPGGPAGPSAAATRLLGDGDASAAAAVDQWLDLCGRADGAAAAAPADTAAWLAAALDAHLATRTYLAGYVLTLADAAAFLMLQRLGYAPGNGAGGSVGRHVARWYKMVAALPEVAGAAKAAAAAVEGSGGERVAANGNRGGPRSGAPKGSNLTDASQGGCPPLEGAVEGEVVTRFPPEPSGYLHIGHAKACILNEYYARHYKGKLICRFDDTNPNKEKEEFEENIIKDLETMGIRPDHRSWTSDWFPQIVALAEKLILEGKAYMDDTPQELMREERMAKKESKNRNMAPAESLRLFKLMCAGDPAAADYCLRLVGIMNSDNGTMRDPVLYRMNLTPHHRTGTKFKAYPTYDFACPIVDSLEGVTHALRTTEYNDRDEQYYLVQELLGLRKVLIHSFARMNFVRTVLSKRKLTWFVSQGLVEDWFDPRFPTVQGVMRRGVSVTALRQFIYGQGASRRIVNMEWDKFWSQNKKMYEPTAPRYMGVAADSAVELRLEGVEGAEGDIRTIQVPLVPKDPSLGHRACRIESTVLLEWDDAQPAAEGEVVTLMRWTNVRLTKVVRRPAPAAAAAASAGAAAATDGAGEVVALEGVVLPEADPAVTKTTRKLSWLAKTGNAVAAKLVEFDYLITKDRLEDDDKLEDFVNPHTKAESDAWVDPAMRSLNVNDVVQLERRGFFRCDRPYLGPGKPLSLFLIPDGKTKAMSTLTKALKHV